MKKVFASIIFINLISICIFANSSGDDVTLFPSSSIENLEDSLKYKAPEDIQEPEITTIEPVIEDETPVESELVTDTVPPLIEDNGVSGVADVTTDAAGNGANTDVGTTTGAEDIKGAGDADAEKPATDATNVKGKNTDSLPDFTKEAIDIEKYNIDSKGNIELANVADKEEESQTLKEANVKYRPSRSVTLKRKEYVDITYPGTGWIYMGITDGSRDLLYFGRALGTKDTTFSLQARNPGTKNLHFYKNDYLTGKYIDDYVEVVILDEEGSKSTRIAAPAYKQPAKTESTEKPATETKSAKSDVSASGAKTSDSVKSQSESSGKNENSQDAGKEKEQEENAVPLVIPDTSVLISEAESLYNEGKYKEAKEKINLFLNYAAKNIDKGLYLKGKILEAKSDIQDIKGAYDAYTKLTKEYPASRYWDDANKRIIYLKRFYLEAR